MGGAGTGGGAGSGAGAAGVAGGLLAVEVCAPLLLLCWLCCWPDDASGTHTHTYLTYNTPLVARDVHIAFQ